MLVYILSSNFITIYLKKKNNVNFETMTPGKAEVRDSEHIEFSLVWHRISEHFRMGCVDFLKAPTNKRQLHLQYVSH